MTLISPARIAADQFRPERADAERHADPKQFLYLVPGLVVGFLAVLTGTHLTAAATLLTSTSIMTGLTFSMTTTFWSRSIDARQSERSASNASVLNALDDARNHLMWTVMVGCISTGCLTLIAIFAAGPAPVWATAVAGALVVYMLTLVLVALQRFAEAALLLR